MREQISRLYDDVTMPQRCCSRIEEALDTRLAEPEKTRYTMKQEASQRVRLYPLLAALCLILGLMGLALGWEEIPQLQSAQAEPSATQPDWLEVVEDEKNPDVFILVPNSEGGTTRHWINQLLSGDIPTIHIEQQADGTWKYCAVGGEYEGGWLGRKTLGWAEWSGVTWDGDYRLESYAALNSHNAEGTEWFAMAQLWLEEGRGMHKAESPAEGSLPEWLALEDGRLYYIWDGQHTDITKLIAKGGVFTDYSAHVLEDNRYVAVGGSFDPATGDISGLGWAQWQLSDFRGCWRNSYFHNTEDENGDFLPWYQTALEQIGFDNTPVPPLRPEDLENLVARPVLEDP